MKPFAFALCLALLAPSLSYAATPLMMHCGPYSSLAALLTDSHSERILHVGQTAEGYELQQ